jgi:hypothetical protein
MKTREVKQFKENNKPLNQVTGPSMVPMTALANPSRTFLGSLSGIVEDPQLLRVVKLEIDEKKL